MGQFSLERAALHQAAQEIAQTRSNLLTQRAQIGRSVDALLGSGWQGEARNTYQSGWAEWNSDADQVLAGLDEMGRAIAAALHDYEAQDHLAATGLDHVGAALTPASQPGPVHLNV